MSISGVPIICLSEYVIIYEGNLNLLDGIQKLLIVNDVIIIDNIWDIDIQGLCEGGRQKWNL